MDDLGVPHLWKPPYSQLLGVYKWTMGLSQLTSNKKNGLDPKLWEFRFTMVIMDIAMTVTSLPKVVFADMLFVEHLRRSGVEHLVWGFEVNSFTMVSTISVQNENEA